MLNVECWAFLIICLLSLGTIPSLAADSDLAWPKITSQQKPWAFWWWMGSAVDKANITKELTRYRDAGMGGVHIIPIYGAKGWEDKYINYLSPQWLEMMSWSVTEAKRLGMGVDMTTGSGWCFGGPQVTDDEANANAVVRTFTLTAGQQLDQKFDHKTTQALVAYSADGKVQDLTDTLTESGQTLFTPASGTWTIYAISQKPSGQKVKRAGPGGEGWMLNLIYPHAMDDFLKPYSAAFDKYPGAKPRAQYHDSYEYRSEWSPDFFAQFEKRRGYRLQTELPALFSTGNDEHSARVLCDYRQTVSEIMAEESLPKWVNWSHRHGFITRNQAHGSPGNWLDLYAAVDIPETEMFHSDRNKLISKFASSAAHVTGKPLISSETGTWIEEHFTEKLSDVKYLFDDMFLSGINHMFYHGCIYSPDEAGWPGWHFYASLEMNPRNSIWRDADALNAYAARCQAVLQSGQPDNDVLVYWNIADFWMQPGGKLLPQLTVHARDWFEGQPIGRLSQELWNRGYAFDYVSDGQLKTAKVLNGKVQMPGGNYQVIVVPEAKYIPLTTFKQLLALAEKGATVVFENHLPAYPSGLDASMKAAHEFGRLTQSVARNLSGEAPGVSLSKIGRGRVLLAEAKASVPELLQSRRVANREVLADAGLSFIRRSFNGGWNYFIANRTEKNFDGWIPLARPARSAGMLNPMTGETGVAATRQNGANQTETHLQLAAGESLILRAFADKKDSGPAWKYWQSAGQPTQITGSWQIQFLTGGPALPTTTQTASLSSWTALSDTNAQSFGGTAKYTTTFDAPDSKPEIQNAKFALDLGDVRQSARVKLNAKNYGTLIAPPFRVVVDNLKPAGNVLEVEVTSVDANRIRDLDRRGVAWKTFRDINFVNLNYKPFDASDWPLTDCGLLGPVTLTPLMAK
ncbi:MAG: glycosyl hydrolase [Verrucomicrobiota bacterium]